MFDANKKVKKILNGNINNLLGDNQIFDFDTWDQDNKPKINNTNSKNYYN